MYSLHVWRLYIESNRYPSYVLDKSERLKKRHNSQTVHLRKTEGVTAAAFSGVELLVLGTSECWS